MEKLFKQLNKIAKQVVLTKDEKSQEREKILNFVSTHPISNISLARQQWTWPNFLSSSWQTKPVAIFATILLAIFAVGGVSFASQSSLPGDTLYPIKLKTEEIRSVLSFSTQAKAQLESRLAQKRLEEAEQLSNESKLDSDARGQLETNFEEHANRAGDETKLLASTDAKAAADINSNLEVSLKAHDRILVKLAEVKDGKIGPEIGKLLIKVRAETEDANKNKNDEEDDVKVQTQVDVQAAAEGRLNSAEDKIIEVRAFINQTKRVIGADAVANAEARLQVAEHLVIQGKAKLDARAYNHAFILFGQAHRVAQGAKLLVQARKDFNVDVKFNSDNNSETDSGDNVASTSSQIQTHTDGRLKVRLGL